eukprot:scaffold4635_cov267-Pinguiococcus_pyrenoidosus.AAC.2
MKNRASIPTHTPLTVGHTSFQLPKRCDPIRNTPIVTFVHAGKEMDGWESRRKRVAGHDWAIVELGLPGEIQLLEVDTAFFTGNQAPRISVQAVELPEGTTDALRELRLQRCVGRADGGRIGLHANQQELDMAEELGSRYLCRTARNEATRLLL